MFKHIEGQSLVKGEASGYATISFKSKKINVSAEKIEDRKNEYKKFLDKLDEVKNDIKNSSSYKKNDQAVIMVLKILENEIFEKDIKRLIKDQGYNFLYAIYVVGDKFYNAFLRMNDTEYLKVAEDIKFATNLLISKSLYQQIDDVKNLESDQKLEETILVIKNLTPKNIDLIKNEKVKGIILKTKIEDLKILNDIKRKKIPTVVIGDAVNDITEGTQISIVDEMVAI